MRELCARRKFFRFIRNRALFQTYRFLAPVLSAQFMTAPTGQANEILNLAPAAPPRPLLDILAVETSENVNIMRVILLTIKHFPYVE